MGLPIRKTPEKRHLAHLTTTVLLVFVVWMVLQSCDSPGPNDSASRSRSLRQTFSGDFHVGAALGSKQIRGDDPPEVALIERQFSSVTPENDLKWNRIHPEADSFNFELPDRLVADAMANNQQIIGHTLTWHNQVPDWVFEDADGNLVDSVTLYARMKHHIDQVVGRYRGRIAGWDVVNEALHEDGTLRNSKFFQISGKGYIWKAFEFAADADPEMELYYNDYNMHRPEKVEGAIALAAELRQRGLRIDGIGMQGHWGIDSPYLGAIEQSILRINEVGLKVMITELDIDVLPNPHGILGANLDENFANHPEADPYTDGLPDSVNAIHAQRYKDLFALFLKHSDKIDRVTFWGTHDGHSWKNNWPAWGRTNYCLVFDRNQEPKLAYDHIMDLKRTKQ